MTVFQYISVGLNERLGLRRFQKGFFSKRRGTRCTAGPSTITNFSVPRSKCSCRNNRYLKLAIAKIDTSSILSIPSHSLARATCEGGECLWKYTFTLSIGSVKHHRKSVALPPRTGSVPSGRTRSPSLSSGAQPLGKLVLFCCCFLLVGSHSSFSWLQFFLYCFYIRGATRILLAASAIRDLDFA